jgi:hypothetical protein
VLFPVWDSQVTYTMIADRKVAEIFFQHTLFIVQVADPLLNRVDVVNY